jgi:HAE1 family hydrophobic/amphiphilic exporter-1
MNIAKFAVTRPVAVVMRIAALVLLGAICLTRLPVDLLPKVSVPTVAVVTTWPNVAPEEVESQVTRPIEEAVSSATNLYQVNSSTTEGSSTVRVQFQWGTDIGQAAVEVMQLVERATQRFPTDPTLQTPLVFKFDPTQLPILVFGVSGEQDPVKLRTLLDNQISPMIESANGVASATVTGGQQRAVIIDVDPDRLRAHGLSLADVMRRITEENLNLPAGIAKQGNTEYTIRSLGWFTSTDEVAQIPVGSFHGQLVALRDVATVRDQHAEVRLYTRLNGEPSAGLTVSKQSGANTVETARRVFERLERAKQLYPHLKFGIAYDQSKFISSSVNDVKVNALIGGVLAVLILLFFLRNLRSTLVVALSIPTSIISTFALLYLCGFTLNTMSLGGLALATGLIVDDAVVVLENIFRHIERDRRTSTEAAIEGTNEIMSAVFASTWTVMVVFLPLLLIKGQAGQMFTQFALVVMFSLAVSLLDATTVVPMLATRLIHGEAHRESLENGNGQGLAGRAFARFGQWFNALDGAYRRGLAWAIHHRMLTLGGALAITAASLLLLTQIGTELMPPTDSGDFNISIKMPVGTALAKTDEAMQQIEQMVRSNPNVETVFATVGSRGGMGGGMALTPFQGGLSVKLRDDRKQSTLQVIGDLRGQLSSLPGAMPRLTQFDLVTALMTGGNQSVEVDIFGDDLSTLSSVARDVLTRARGVQGLENLDVNWQEAMPEIQWRVDRRKALQLGISFSDIANTINTATNGTITGYYQEKGFQYPIIVQMPEATRKTVAELQNLAIVPSAPNGSSQPILLSQLAQPVYALGPSQITRQDRQRYIAVTGAPQGRSPGQIQADLQKIMADVKLPSGFYWDWGTDQKRRVEEFGGMWLAVVLAICLIYMLLASQFESFVHPLVILTSVPLSITGVLLALFFTGRSFGLTAFIGLLMLVGIVVKNGILLVDYTNVLRGRGIAREEAVLTAGPTRLRPILMTASAAMLGMLPLALALGKGGEVQAPMATAVIGGLATSTFLTLFVVPVVYTVVDDLALRLGQRRRTRADNSGR